MNDQIDFRHDPSLPDLLELKGVSLTYDDDKVPAEKKKWIIKNLSFLVQDIPNRGQFAVIMGPSGCGKSTILRFLAGLQKPTTGEILIKGRKIDDKEHIGMVFQQFSSLEWYTVLKNVALPLLIRGIAKREAKKRAMENISKMKPAGFGRAKIVLGKLLLPFALGALTKKFAAAKAAEMIKKVGLGGQDKKFASERELSGGQLQRVAIARSLISNPEMILMDEPFGALDPYNRLNMQLMLLEMWEQFQSTVVFVTHSKEEAVFLADDIYIMAANPGRIVRHIHVDLPYPRNLSTRRDKRFFETVSEVDEALRSLTDPSLLK
jgi:NitT/TauT family transport system ATP-binding protein